MKKKEIFALTVSLFSGNVPLACIGVVRAQWERSQAHQ